MQKVIVYGSKHCSSCQPMKDFLESKEIKFAYLDISENLMFLKKFLKLRDSRAEYEQIKLNGQIGIPSVVINDGEHIFFTPDEVDINYIKNSNSQK